MRKNLTRICLVAVLAGFVILLSTEFSPHRSFAQGQKPNVPAGEPTDPELERLLAMVRPYQGDEENPIPPENRFPAALETLLEYDLADESDAFKLSVRKLALRYALRMNRVLDSVEVRWNGFLLPGSTPFPPDRRGWTLGAEIDRPVWEPGRTRGGYDEATAGLFSFRDEKLVGINLDITVGACGGEFSDCCADQLSPFRIDDAWLKDFVDLGLARDFPFATSEITDEGWKYLAKHAAKNPIRSISIAENGRFTPEGLSAIAALDGLEELRFLTDSDEFNAVIFECLPHFPNLRKLEMSPHATTDSQMKRLGECEKLTELKLISFFPESVAALEPLGRLTRLKSLYLSTTTEGSAVFERSFEHTQEFRSQELGFSGETIFFEDFPELTECSLAGFSGNHLVMNSLPELRRLTVDADSLQGDVLSGGSQHLFDLFCTGAKLTPEQIDILSLLPLSRLRFYDLRPESLQSLTPLAGIPSLGDLSMQFASGTEESWKTKSLTVAAPKLRYLRIKFSENNDVRIIFKDVDKLYGIHGVYLSHLEGLKSRPNSIVLANVAMTYSEFRKLIELPKHEVYGTLMLHCLMLLEIDDIDNIFADCRSDYSYLDIRFDEEMKESLCGKRLFFRDWPELRNLYVHLPGFEEVSVKIENCPELGNSTIRLTKY